ncbi:hypothetical protein OE88DRAFT_1663608 [Heliocybe sulcata]|uniref:Uncharacterized protein n=1 Tax=Heliocybe sulcata TaxID=5364 RepID=A0A5C3MV33_9AGAM|nr:hypothetical protein OE88DRAFT_1663608 [Heliocybe sulcata]
MYHRFRIVSTEPGPILQTQGIPLDPSVEENPVPGPSRHRSSSHGHGVFSSNPTRFSQLNFQSYDGQNTRRAISSFSSWPVTPRESLDQRPGTPMEVELETLPLYPVSSSAAPEDSVDNHHDIPDVPMDVPDHPGAFWGSSELSGSVPAPEIMPGQSLDGSDLQITFQHNTFRGISLETGPSRENLRARADSAVSKSSRRGSYIKSPLDERLLEPLRNMKEAGFDGLGHYLATLFDPTANYTSNRSLNQSLASFLSGSGAIGRRPVDIVGYLHQHHHGEKDKDKVAADMQAVLPEYASKDAPTPSILAHITGSKPPTVGTHSALDQFAVRRTLELIDVEA